MDIVEQLRTAPTRLTNVGANAEKMMTAAADEIERLREVARAYERWEADLILANEAWTSDEHVLIPTSLWERMLEIQAMRNRALNVLQPS